jgi:hypothetical protein
MYLRLVFAYCQRPNPTLPTLPNPTHKAHTQGRHGESPTGGALRLRARFAKFCAEFQSELVQGVGRV